VVVLHVGAAAKARRWPHGRFAELAAWCREQGHPVVVTGGGADVEAGLCVVRRAGLPDDASLAGRTSLADLAALVAGARLLVSGDTGVAHLATAYRRPSVVLFGPVSPARWGPPLRPWHAIVACGAGGGDPHAETLDPALARISVADVLGPVQRLLALDLSRGGALPV
jgi:ADP-heptose:LPS heptosyltransferase